MANNQLVSDRNVEFLLYEVFDAEGLCTLNAYQEHSRETFDLVLQNARKFAREVLLPTYKAIDETPAHRVGDGIKVHPMMKDIYPKLVEQGLTPIVKSFSAEKGFESNALAVQIHGGYGYTSEYLPEAWLRDQKLNSIHEGTTCMHSMDLLGRKVVADQGGALRLLAEDVGETIRRAAAAGVDREWGAALERAIAQVGEVTIELASLGMGGQVDEMMLHSVDYLDLFSTVVVSWQWLLQAAVAKEKLAKAPAALSAEFYEGKVCAAEYWIKTELPRTDLLASLCRSGERSYARMNQGWF